MATRGLNYHVCTDCFIWHVNGDDTSFCECEEECTAEDCQAIKDAPGVDRGYYLVLASEEDEDTFFSRYKCDACQRPLGGDRHVMASLIAG